MRNLTVSDYSLRRLGEERGARLLFREKTAVAKCLETCKVDAIELDAIKSLKEDTVIYKTIAASIKESRICLPVGTGENGVLEAWECIKDAAKPCLQICLPVSTVQMEYHYHLKDMAMLKLIASLTAEAAKYCSEVEFIALDATRADREFLINSCLTARDAGATAVTLCDDAGIFLPSEFASLVFEVKAKTEMTVYVQPSDEISLATACALSAIEAGADGVKTAVAGENVLKTTKLARAIKARGESLGVTTSLCQTELYRDISSMLKKVMTVRDGSHEIQNDGIILDTDCSIARVDEAVKLLGYEISGEDLGRVYDAVRAVCSKKTSVVGRELEAIIASTAMQVPSTYHLDSYITTTGSCSAVSRVTLIKNGEKFTGAADGDGPIDSAIRAIEQGIGYHYELDDFQLHSVTSGKEALGSALVRLRSEGKVFSGNGVSSDIVGASIRAYLNALNKIVYEK